ncbi:hypothetical protein PCE1_003532 [Barthelona sp. PCE]
MPRTRAQAVPHDTVLSLYACHDAIFMVSCVLQLCRVLSLKLTSSVVEYLYRQSQLNLVTLSPYNTLSDTFSDTVYLPSPLPEWDDDDDYYLYEEQEVSRTPPAAYVPNPEIERVYEDIETMLANPIVTTPHSPLQTLMYLKEDVKYQLTEFGEQMLSIIQRTKVSSNNRRAPSIEIIRQNVHDQWSGLCTDADWLSLRSIEGEKMETVGVRLSSPGTRGQLVIAHAILKVCSTGVDANEIVHAINEKFGDERFTHLDDTIRRVASEEKEDERCRILHPAAINFVRSVSCMKFRMDSRGQNVYHWQNVEPFTDNFYFVMFAFIKACLEFNGSRNLYELFPFFSSRMIPLLSHIFKVESDPESHDSVFQEVGAPALVNRNQSQSHTLDVDPVDTNPTPSIPVTSSVTNQAPPIMSNVTYPVSSSRMEYTFPILLYDPLVRFNRLCATDGNSEIAERRVAEDFFGELLGAYCANPPRLPQWQSGNIETLVRIKEFVNKLSGVLALHSLRPDLDKDDALEVFNEFVFQKVIENQDNLIGDKKSRKLYFCVLKIGLLIRNTPLRESQRCIGEALIVAASALCFGKTPRQRSNQPSVESRESVSLRMKKYADANQPGKAIRLAKSQGTMPLSDTNVLEQMQSKHPVSAPVSDAILRETMSSFKRGEWDPEEFIISKDMVYETTKKVKKYISAGADGVMPYLLKLFEAEIYRNDRYMDAFTQVINDYAFGSRPWALWNIRLIALNKKHVEELQEGEHMPVRPIAVASALGGIADKIIASQDLKFQSERVKKYLFKHKQFGAGMRDATALVANLVDVNLKRSDRNVALVIDIANAFNSVRRDKLLHIVAAHAPWCFQAYHQMCKRPIPIWSNGERLPFDSCMGVLQGNATSPLLFALLIAEVLKDTKAVAPDSVNMYAYADDIYIVGEPSTVMSTFDVIKGKLEFYNLKVNAEKCELVGYGAGSIAFASRIFPRGEEQENIATHNLSLAFYQLLGTQIGDFNVSHACARFSNGVKQLLEYISPGTALFKYLASMSIDQMLIHHVRSVTLTEDAVDDMERTIKQNLLLEMIPGADELSIDEAPTLRYPLSLGGTGCLDFVFLHKIADLASTASVSSSIKRFNLIEWSDFTRLSPRYLAAARFNYDKDNKPYFMPDAHYQDEDCQHKLVEAVSLNSETKHEFASNLLWLAVNYGQHTQMESYDVEISMATNIVRQKSKLQNILTKRFFELFDYAIKHCRFHPESFISRDALMSQRSVAWSLDATVATWPQRSVANIHSMFDERYMFGYALAGIYQLLFPELREMYASGRCNFCGEKVLDRRSHHYSCSKNHGLVVKLHNNILEKTVDTVRKSGNAHIFNLDKPIPKRKFEEYSDIHRVQLGWTHERYESGESCPNRKERKRPDFAILEASGPKVVVDVMTTSPFTSKDRGHVRAAYFYKKLNKYKTLMTRRSRLWPLRTEEPFGIRCCGNRRRRHARNTISS